MINILKEIIQYRELLYSLSLKDLKIRYKQTFLGLAWAVFSPVSMMLIFTFIFNRMARIPTGAIPYSIFVYCGLVPWTFFSASLTGAVVILVNNSNLVTKVYFPREVFPLSVIISKFVDFAVASLVLAGMMIFYGIPFRATMFLVPFILLIQLMLMIGLSFFLAMGNLFYRDVKYIFEVVILLWMFATSVIYPINTSSTMLYNILMLNPMTPIINAYRDLILNGVLPEPGPLLFAAIISLLVFAAGTLSFHRAEYLFAENI
ncbi:MAG: ABC transporter permease [Candidatus Omnitrophica bacterium]|nr:ABC transporter permease [Candidatus Omnitrophota bacterium]